MQHAVRVEPQAADAQRAQTAARDDAQQVCKSMAGWLCTDCGWLGQGSGLGRL